VRAIPAGVGTTAIGVCRLRAVESARLDRLFDDPLAGALVEMSGWSPDRPGPDRRDDPAGRAALTAWIAIRTRFLDDLLTDAVGAGCTQVVLVGAGLDTRAFRLPWPPSTACFELDTPEVLAYKEEALGALGARPGCRRVAVPADLRADWPHRLGDAGWDPGRPTAWVAEGLLVYLTDAVRDRLVEQVSARSAPGSRLGLTADARAGEGGRPGRGFRALYRSTAWDDPAAALDGQGWRTEVFDPRERSAAYGRPGPPRLVTEAPAALLVSARRAP
jgi:methyltransferase (TIGR00027 family)